jgi:uncharacterized protein YcfJ
MFKKLTIAGAALAMGVTTLVPATPAMAQRYSDGYYQTDRYGNPVRQYRGRDRNYNRGYRGYRAAQKCRDGDGGTIVGAIAGGLAGNTIAGRGDRLLGTVLGGALGAVAGRAIDRSDRPNYCR